jgi:CheY-like chemotaxis protein
MERLMRALLGWLFTTSGVVLISTGHGDILVYAPLAVMAICALSGFLAAHHNASPTLRTGAPGIRPQRAVAYHRVLIVEDEPVLRRVLARNLFARGLAVRVVLTGADAAAELGGGWPDLMLLDVDLPDRSGWDLMREMRRRGIVVPTIVMSAVRVGRVRIDELGPMAVLPKPFPLDELFRLVNGSADAVDDLSYAGPPERKTAK